MKVILSAVLLTMFTGCSTVSPQYVTDQERAHAVAVFVNERAGFIQDAISALVRVAVYSAKEGTDKEQIVAICHAVSANLNVLLVNGEADPVSIREAFKVKESYLDGLLSSGASIVSSEIQKLKADGYGDAVIAILAAASKGVQDGTAQ